MKWEFSQGQWAGFHPVGGGKLPPQIPQLPPQKNRRKGGEREREGEREGRREEKKEKERERVLNSAHFSPCDSERPLNSEELLLSTLLISHK